MFNFFFSFMCTQTTFEVLDLAKAEHEVNTYQLLLVDVAVDRHIGMQLRVVFGSIQPVGLLRKYSRQVGGII